MKCAQGPGLNVVLLVAVASGILLAGPDLVAQDVRSVSAPGDPQPISIDTVAVIAEHEEGIGPTIRSMVHAGPDGSVMVSPTWTEGRVGLWSRNGKYRGAFGRAGEGPGEFRHAATIWVDRHDTVHVVSGGRRDLFFAGEYVRSAPWTPTYTTEVVPLPHGGHLQAGFTRSDPGMRGHPVHHFSADGSYVGSLGRKTGYGASGRPPGVRIAPGPADTHVWIAQTDRYEIERIPLADGQQHVVLDRRAAWFPDPSGPAPSRSTGEDPLMPMVYWIHEDAQGLVWIAIRIASPDGGPPDTTSILTVDDLHSSFDMLIEVIDPANARVVARRVLDRVMPLGWATEDLAYDLATDPVTGLVHAYLLELEAVRRDDD